MLTKRPPSAQRKSKRPRRKFQVTVSTVWEFGTDSEAVEEEQERERFGNLLSLTNRQSFKNNHDGSKPVWPEAIEAALVEGLTIYYTLHGKKDFSRKLKKIPYRNRFITEHILTTTNEPRTPRQVASRLQQLRQSTQNDTVRHLINCRAVAEEQLQSLSAACSADSLWLPPQILLQSPPQSILVHALNPTLVLLSPVALTLYSTFELFINNIWHSSSAAYLIPDGIRNGRSRAYVASFPDDLRDLFHRRSQDRQCTEWSILQSIFRQHHETDGTIQSHFFVKIHYGFQQPCSTADQKHPTALSEDRLWPPLHTAPQSAPHRETSLYKSENTFYSIAGTYNNVRSIQTLFYDFIDSNGSHAQFRWSTKVSKAVERARYSTAPDFFISPASGDPSQRVSPSTNVPYSYSNNDHDPVGTVLGMVSVESTTTLLRCRPTNGIFLMLPTPIRTLGNLWVFTRLTTTNSRRDEGRTLKLAEPPGTGKQQWPGSLATEAPNLTRRHLVQDRHEAQLTNNGKPQETRRRQFLLTPATANYGTSRSTALAVNILDGLALASGGMKDDGRTRGAGNEATLAAWGASGLITPPHTRGRPLVRPGAEDEEKGVGGVAIHVRNKREQEKAKPEGGYGRKVGRAHLQRSTWRHEFNGGMRVRLDLFDEERSPSAALRRCMAAQTMVKRDLRAHYIAGRSLNNRQVTGAQNLQQTTLFDFFFFFARDFMTSDYAKFSP
ncbi:hypothetical protein B0H14DRAFT_2585699 [Mycena olivaceomarginata]|nr:hypothetical protein B0H14DRAFT_2585699 [Mycena olivaceomarginata]